MRSTTRSATASGDPGLLHSEARCAARTLLYRAMVSDRSRARSSVNLRRNGVKTDGFRGGRLLVLTQVLPSIEGEGDLQIAREVFRCLPDIVFDRENFLEAPTFEMLAVDERSERDAQRHQ